MTTYLITYDLRSPGQNYGALHDLLGREWRGQRLTESLWLCDLAGPAETIRDLIVNLVDANDRIAVLELATGIDWAVQQGMAGGVTKLRGLASRRRLRPAPSRPSIM